MFYEKIKEKLEKKGREEPIVHQFKILVDTKVFVFDLDGLIDSKKVIENIYWVKENLGGVDMSSSPYEKDGDVIMTWHSDWFLQKQTNIFDDLIKIVEEKVLYCIGKPEERQAKITEAWAMINKKGDQIIRHKHFEQGYSAVYYALADKNANPLVFDNNLSIIPKSNTLICFPGYLYHRVPILQSEQERILMAFNLWCSSSKVIENE